MSKKMIPYEEENVKAKTMSRFFYPRRMWNEAVQSCPNRVLLVKEGDVTRYYWKPCLRWDCPVCGRLRRYAASEALWRQVMELKLYRHLILEIPPWMDDGYHAARDMVARFRDAVRRRYGDTPMLALFHCDDGRWHIHAFVHPFLNVRWLQERWRKISGGGFFKAKLIKYQPRDARRAVFYATRDLGTPEFEDALPVGRKHFISTRHIGLERYPRFPGDWLPSCAEGEEVSSGEYVLVAIGDRILRPDLYALWLKAVRDAGRSPPLLAA